MRSFGAALAASLVVTAGHTPRAIVPGDASLRLDRVPLGTDTLVIVAARPHRAEQRLVTLVRRVERAEDDRGAIFREVQRYVFSGDEDEVDTLDVSARTLAMHRVVETRGLEMTSLRFDGARLTGWITAGDATTRPIDVATGPFFHSMMTEAFVGAYPLSPGTTIVFPELRETNLVVRPATLTADGTAAIATAAGWVDCLVVHGAQGVTMWIARADGRLVRLRWMEPDGTVMWKLPPADLVLR